MVGSALWLAGLRLWAAAGAVPDGGPGLCPIGVEGSCEDSPTVLTLDHLLLQMQSATKVHREYEDEWELLQLERQEPSCQGLANVDSVCGPGGCKVVASKMMNRSCQDFCGDSGLDCVGAWEQAAGTCDDRGSLDCAEQWVASSKLLCECKPRRDVPAIPTALPPAWRPAPEPSPVATQPQPPAQWPGADPAQQPPSLNPTPSQPPAPPQWPSQDPVQHPQPDPVPTQLPPVPAPPPGLPAPQPTQGPQQGGTSSTGAPLELVWSDDFNGVELDGSKWDVETGGGGFGNRELQHYTDRDDNAHVSSGTLKITAKCEKYDRESFTSAKLSTKTTAAWGPGHRVEVRVRLPTNRGAWPGVWMLPKSNAYGGWPHSGEIDIMESVGCTPNKVFGTVHTGAYNHVKGTAKGNSIAADNAGWNVYAIDWEENRIRWTVDGTVYHEFNKEGGDPEKWPFDKEFYLILNVAVGGSWGGSCLSNGWPSCSRSDQFGSQCVMEVDYARVYRIKAM